MRIGRRRFLGISVLAGLWASACGRTLRPPPAGSERLGTLEAYLDTLIPADATPGAVELGVPEKILARAARNTRYRELIERGCAWLDRQARKHGAAHFGALNESQRALIVRLARKDRKSVV